MHHTAISKKKMFYVHQFGNKFMSFFPRQVRIDCNVNRFTVSIGNVDKRYMLECDILRQHFLLLQWL